MKKLNGFYAVGLGVAMLGAVSASAAETVYESSNSRSKPAFGVQAGINFDTATTPNQINSNTHTGFTVGLALDLPIITGAASLSLAPELNYSRRGLDLINAGGIKASVNRHSIELPVFAKVAFGEGVRPYVFGGPMGVWNVSNELSGDIGGAGKSISYDPRTFDLAVVAGAGVEIGPFFANARYNFGLVDIDSRSADWRSRGFKLLAGLKF